MWSCLHRCLPRLPCQVDGVDGDGGDGDGGDGDGGDDNDGDGGDEGEDYVITTRWWLPWSVSSNEDASSCPVQLTLLTRAYLFLKKH